MRRSAGFEYLQRDIPIDQARSHEFIHGNILVRLVCERKRSGPDYRALRSSRTKMYEIATALKSLRGDILGAMLLAGRDARKRDRMINRSLCGATGCRLVLQDFDRRT